MNRHLVTAMILLVALTLYGFGFAGLGLIAFCAGAVFELWFWFRVIFRRRATSDTGRVPGK
jgi:hypothetical protein